MRICSSCKTEKDWEDFGVDKTAKANNFRKYQCKACTNKKRRGKYGKENRDRYLKSKYGISDKDYKAMLADQSGLCAICRQVGEMRSGGKRAKDSMRLYVDHDHVSGDVRGLLCHKCNVAIGLLYDDPTRIERAADYIRGMPCA